MTTQGSAGEPSATAVVFTASSIRLSCIRASSFTAMSRRAAGSIVRMRTVRVAPALTASDGRSFDYDTNVVAYEREMGLRGLRKTEKRGAASLTELASSCLQGPVVADARTARAC